VKALLNPIAVETQLIQERRYGPSQIMHSERLKRQAFLLGLFDNGIGHTIERQKQQQPILGMSHVAPAA
jgi:hypothetical protein